MSHGVIGQVGLGVRDPVRVAAFFDAVLGSARWGRAPRVRLTGAANQPGVQLGFCVADLDAAAATVRRGGGVAGTPAAGAVACTDDQGVPFTLHAAAPAAAPGGHGDVAYFTIGVADLSRAQAFYGALFGWTFTALAGSPGAAIAGVLPGGALWRSELPGCVLTFRVDDVRAAAHAVLARGGTTGAFERRPYGIASDNCTDGRGTRFHLLQFAQSPGIPSSSAQSSSTSSSTEAR